MVNRNRPIVRTPKRPKVWAHSNELTVLGAGTSSPKVINLLESFFNDLGSGPTGGTTAMRMVGQLALRQWTAIAATATYEIIRCGVAWLDKNVAGAGDGDAQIPEPLLDGVRETNWLQQWQVEAIEGPSSVVTLQLEPFETARKLFDVTQQRKQPNAHAELCLVISGGDQFEANTVVLDSSFSIMCALP